MALKQVLHRIEQPRPWQKLLSEDEAHERFEVETADGSFLTIRRVRPHPEREERAKPPVMLLHGLGANHQTFLFPERSIAHWLAEQGRDVFVPDLRGHGDSIPCDYHWGLDEYLCDDLPEIITSILDISGQDRVDWVGHSMGGVLLMCYGALYPDAPIASGVAIASAIDYGVGASNFANLAAIRPLIEPLSKPAEIVPFGGLMHLLAPALGKRPFLLERFNMWPENIEPWVMRRIHARCFHAIPATLLLSLASTFEDSGFRLRTGESLRDRAMQFEPPLHILAGTRDTQVSIKAIEATCDRVGANASFEIFGKQHGQREDYGHFDLILGRHAQDEVWPRLEASLS